MKDNRKNIKATPTVKTELQAVLKEIAPGKTESYVLAYLLAMYKDQKSKRISLANHQAYLKKADKLNN